MAGKLTYSDSTIQEDSFVRLNYPISIRDNLSSINYVDEDQKKRMNEFYSKHIGKPFSENKFEKD